MSLLRDIFGGQTNYDPGPWGQGMVRVGWGPGRASAPITTDSAMQLSAVFACLRLLSENVATMPLDTFIRSGGTRAPYRPRPEYLNFQPPQGSRIDYISQVMLSLLSNGNTFVATPRNALGVPLDLIVIDPCAVRVERSNVGVDTYYVGNNEYDSFDIMHIKAMTMPGALRGLSPLGYARESVALGLSAQEFGDAFFANGALPAGIIEAPGEFPRDAAERAATLWNSKHRGTSNAGKVGVLTGGARFTKVTITPEESQFLGTRAFQVPDIARFFGVPPHLIADASNSTSWGCLPGDSLVFTIGGPKPIEAVVPGDEVWSFDGSAMVAAKVTGWKMTGHKPIRTIRTQARTLRATDNHRVPVRRYFGFAQGRKRGGCGWETITVRADEVQVGDYLLMPHGMGDGNCRVAPNGRALTPGAMEFLGFYLGDGNPDGRRVELAHAAQNDYMDHYRQVIRDEFGVEPYMDKGRLVRTRFSSKDARSLLDCGFTGNAHTKRVPEWVFRLDRDLQLACLRGFVDSDGSIGTSGIISFKSCNPALLEDLRHLCIQLGVATGRVRASRKAGTGQIRGKTHQSKGSFILDLQHVEHNHLIGSNSPAKASRLRARSQFRQNRYEPGWLGGDMGRANPQYAPGHELDLHHVVLDRVQTIQAGTIEVPVYDIEVDGPAHFAADGLIVHNSGLAEQNSAFGQFSLRPWVDRIEDAHNRLLTSQGLPQVFMRLNMDAVLRADTKERYDAYAVGIDNAYLTVNEVRRLEDLPPVPWGDTPLYGRNINQADVTAIVGDAPPAVQVPPVQKPPVVPAGGSK